MIGHQTVGQDAHRAALVSLVQQAEERGVVRRLMENLLPRVAPIEDVIAIAARSKSFRPRHVERVYSTCIPASIIRPDPFLLPTRGSRFSISRRTPVFLCFPFLLFWPLFSPFLAPVGYDVIS